MSTAVVRWLVASLPASLFGQTEGQSIRLLAKRSRYLRFCSSEPKASMPCFDEELLTDIMTAQEASTLEISSMAST